MSRQQAWQMKMKSLGLCVRCGKPAVTKCYCLKHLVEAREKQRQRLGCKRRFSGSKSYRLESQWGASA